MNALAHYEQASNDSIKSAFDPKRTSALGVTGIIIYTPSRTSGFPLLDKLLAAIWTVGR